MYMASKRTSEEDLNERVPLSVARWHRHVNWCIPGRRDEERWYETQDGQPVFGWMVHATTFAGNDLKAIWHDDHMDHDHPMMGDPKNP